MITGFKSKNAEAGQDVDSASARAVLLKTNTRFEDLSVVGFLLPVIVHEIAVQSSWHEDTWRSKRK